LSDKSSSFVSLKSLITRLKSASCLLYFLSRSLLSNQPKTRRNSLSKSALTSLVSLTASCSGRPISSSVRSAMQSARSLGLNSSSGGAGGELSPRCAGAGGKSSLPARDLVVLSFFWAFADMGGGGTDGGAGDAASGSGSGAVGCCSRVCSD